jgi:hypothetical protein
MRVPNDLPEATDQDRSGSGASVAVELRQRITERILRFLNEPRPGHARRGWNDAAALRRHLRKGDVVLVAGDNRVSAIIRYLTQSAWSHAALYIGDEILRRGGPRA